MKKTKLSLQPKLSMKKEIISKLDAQEQAFVAGGGPNTAGCPALTTACPPVSLNCTSVQNCPLTISICNDQCAVTWGCPRNTNDCPVPISNNSTCCPNG